MRVAGACRWRTARRAPATLSERPRRADLVSVSIATVGMPSAAIFARSVARGESHETTPSTWWRIRFSYECGVGSASGRSVAKRSRS
jgi:hypothetical protein